MADSKEEGREQSRPLHHLGTWIVGKFNKRPWVSYPLLVGFLIFLFSWRWLYEPLALGLRTHAQNLLLVVLVLTAVVIAFRLKGWRRRVGALAAAVLILGGAIFFAFHGYFALAVRQNTFGMEEIGTLPLTDNERAQPWFAVKSAAEHARDNTLAPTDPAFVRDADGSYHFTMAFQPTYFIPRLSQHVNEVYSIPGTAGTIGFGPEHRVPVTFDVGESLLLAHSVHTCMVRSFNPWQFFSYESTSPIYLKDDSGQMVTVVPLIRWTGFLFMRPEFGGVEVIPQQERTLFSLGYLKMLFFGCGGYWVPPEEIGQHPFLVGQNLVPDQVSRYMAQSFRFYQSFWRAAPWNHAEDLRLPDMPGDMRDLPFVAYFTKPGEKNGKLYQYFPLEPYDLTKHGLALSVFVPGDGIGPTLVYNHAIRNEGLIGPSIVGSYVMSSQKMIDRTDNRPVESRPFIRNLCGRIHMMWITTIVTFNKDGTFTGGTPADAITDAEDKTVYWVNPNASGGWAKEVEGQMCPSH